MPTLTRDEYDKLEVPQKRHRVVNSLLSVLVVVMGYFFIQSTLTPIYNDVTGITEQRVEREEISQIFNDESLVLCSYNDSLGNATIGVGHLITPKESFPKCITPHQAFEILIIDYRYAKQSVEKKYPWAEDEVKLVLINLTFQLGATGLSKFEMTLKYLEDKQYILAAGELLDSVMYRQTPKRLQRHAARILSLGVQ